MKYRLILLSGILLFFSNIPCRAQPKIEDNIKVEVHGDAQIDGRFFTKYSPTNINSFYLRRLRPIVQGTIYKNFDFRLQPNFAGSRIELQDAYLGYNQIAFAKVRIGKFKAPVGLERLQSPNYTAFIEFSYPTSLVPNRDIGFQISGNILNGIINYAAGIFNGTVDGQSEDTENNNAKDINARLFFLPFKGSIELLQNAGIGISYTTGKQKGTNDASKLPSYRSTGQQTVFRFLSDGTSANTVLANGNRKRISPQTYIGIKSIGLMGEYVISDQEVIKANNSAKLVNTAWQVTGSFVLTGENATYNGVKPKDNFDIDQGKFGAFELVARAHGFKVDKDAFPLFSDPKRSASESNAYGIGVNWYLNEFLKVAVNFEYSVFKNINGLKPIEDERVILSRFLVAF